MSLAGINEDLVTFLGVDESDVVKGVKRANKELDKFATKAAKSVTKAGRRFQSLGRTFTLAITAPLTALSASLVKTASDAEETSQKFNVVFREVAGAANAASKDIASSYGIANDQTEMLLGNTGDLLTGFGFAQDAALDLSIQTNKLAADLGSFTNIEGGAKAASNALNKALVGEAESVKALGIVIRQDTKEYQDLVQSIQDTEQVSLIQAKALAALTIATEQSQNAIGDFQRSIDSTANQTKIFLADLRNLRVDMGKRLIPAYRQLLALSNDLVQRFSMLSDEAKQDVIQIAALTAAIGPLLFIGGTALVFLGTFTGAMITAASSVASFGLALATTFGGLALTIAAPIALVAAAVGVIGLLFANLIGFRRTAKIVFEGITGIWTKTANFFSEFVEFMTDGNKDMADSTKTAVMFIGTAWIGLRFGLNGATEMFAGFTKNVLSQLGSIVHGFEQAKQDIGNAIDNIKNFWKKGLGIGLGTDAQQTGQVAKTPFELQLEHAKIGIDLLVADLKKKNRELVFDLADVPGAIKKDAEKFKEAFNVVLKQIESVPLVGRVKEIVAEIKEAFASLGLLGADVGAEGGGLDTALMEQLGALGGANIGGPVVSGPEGDGAGGGFLGAFNAALADNMVKLEDWAQFAVSTIDTVAQGFTDGFKAIISGEKGFGKSLISILDTVSTQMLDLAFKSIFQRIAMAVVQTKANAFSAAPSPFLIPLFVGVAVAGMAAVLGGTEFSGAQDGSGAGGGASVTPPPMATATVVEGEDVDDDVRVDNVERVVVFENDFGEALMKFNVQSTKKGIGDGVDILALRGA